MDPQQEFRLGDWQVTPLRGVLHGPAGARKLTPKAMDLLLCLVRHGGDVVSRDTLVAEVWQGRAFSDDPINKAIAELRRELGDRRDAPKYIETIPKRGYRIVAEIAPIGQQAVARNDAQASDKGGKRLYQVIAAGALLMLAITIFLQLGNQAHRPVDHNASIAVLPFEVLSSADSKEYFADGMHEELIAALSQQRSLSVRSRTSTLQYRDTDLSIPEIADELNVDVILEGSVRQEGNRVRVTAQLLHAASDSHLWSENFEAELSVEELFSIQNSIALAISNALQVTLNDPAQTLAADLPTTHLAAYDHFMLGKYHYRRQLPGDIALAVDHLESAVDLDSQFADAWDWLAYAYNHAATQVGHMSPDEAYPKARTAALRALDIEPNLATAVAILGYVRAVYDWDWVGAERDMRRALDLNPSDSGTVWSLAHTLALQGRHDEAIRLAADFAALNPAIGRRHMEVANRLVDALRYQEALERIELAQINGAELAQVEDLAGTVHYGLGELEQAIDKLEYAVIAKQRAAGTVARLAHVLAVANKEAESRELLAELEERAESEAISAMSFATVHAGLEQREQTLEYLEQAAADRDRAVLNIGNDTYFQALHDEPRFQTILERFNFPKSIDTDSAK